MLKHGVQMVYQMNNEIINEINIFVKTIKDSKIYKEYITLLEKVNKSEEIKVLVTDIRNIQKKLVKNPSIELENILKQKQAELNDIPIYLDYKDKIEELNNVLLTVKDKFDSFIEELIIQLKNGKKAIFLYQKKIHLKHQHN